MNFKKLFLVLVFLFSLMYSNEILAQCAMCKANAESNLKAGGSVAKGLNTGILYLMAVPYLIIGTLFFLFFKKQILEKFQIAKMRFLKKI